MPKFRDLMRYCEKNGWEQYKKGTHHYFYRKYVNGKMLKTYVSHSLGKEIPPRIWKEILKNQIKTTEEEFNKNK